MAGMSAKATADYASLIRRTGYGLDRVTKYQYDGLDRISSTTLSEGGVTSYAYDANNNVLTRTSTPKLGSPLSSLTTAYTYDGAFNKPITIADPLGLVTTMSYDGSGNLLVSNGYSYGRQTGFAWLPHGGTRLVNLIVPGPKGDKNWDLSGIAWDGQYFVLDAYYVFRVSLIHGQAYYVDEILLDYPEELVILVAVPPGFPSDYALADLLGEPRPLMIRGSRRIVSYILCREGDTTPYCLKESDLRPTGESVEIGTVSREVA